MSLPSSSPLIGRTIQDWIEAGRDPATLTAELRALLDGLDKDDPAWIAIADIDTLAGQIEAVFQRRAEGADLPLLGVPLAVKDNIDVAGFETTAACPVFAYRPEHSAAVVKRLTDAGAIVIGKTNLDQFATGLVGARSPYGAVPNSFNPDFISGGSSSGSASVVARGLVPFALGTDTAGSGRVPAGANNLVGLKPTRGAWSSTGLVPACRTLDCITVMATTVSDVLAVDRIARGFDPADALSRRSPAGVRTLPARPRLGVPADPQFFNDEHAGAAWRAALERIDAEWVSIDFTPLHAVADLLYGGPWVAERLAAIAPFFADHAKDMDPTVRSIIEGGAAFSAVDVFRAQYRLAELSGPAQAIMASIDALLVPTTPCHPTIAEVTADPIAVNSRLGVYTNFVNLLDWSALAVPAGFRGDGLPFGVTLIGPTWGELGLAGLAARWERRFDLPRGATGMPLPTLETALSNAPAALDTLRLAVVGAHLTGMPLNHELTDRGATFVERSATSMAYRLYALNNTTPPKPGLARVGDNAGGAIEVELWDMPLAQVGGFLAGIPAPLGLGSLELFDGRTVKGFICEGHAIAGAKDITAFGGWRAYRAADAGR
jgi:allophanate hydrolase